MAVETTSFPSDAPRRWTSLYPEGVPSDLTSWASSPVDYFARAVALDPSAPALWYFDASISYGALDRQSAALSRALAARGVAAGDRIAIMNQNTPATVIGLLAAWRLGAIAVLLSPMLTRHELGHYLHDCQPVLAIIGADQASAWPQDLGAGPVRNILVSYARDFLAGEDVPPLLQPLVADCDLPAGWEPLAPLLEGEATADPWPKPDMSAAAVLTYTSGTTGKPKAAINSHGNIAFNAEVWRSWLKIDSNDVLLAAAPFSHVTGLVAHIATAFAAAAPLVTCYRFEPATVLGLIEARGCTTTVAAITAYIAMLEHPTFDPQRLGGFRKLFSGGAPVAPTMVDRWETATGVYIHNAYGLTETTSPSHLVPLGRRAPVDPLTGVLSVGVPAPNTLCRVVDSEGNEVPTGELGELLTRGPQVIAGYWRQPDETDRAFTADHYLKTGDICRTDEEGWFYLVDRAKDMIVASGFKVWPREVEDVLVTHPAVSEAAVIGVADAYRGESPKAFVVLRPGQSTTEEELRKLCRERLAPYKTPRQFVIVDALPKTPSGKVLRRELRDLP